MKKIGKPSHKRIKQFIATVTPFMLEAESHHAIMRRNTNFEAVDYRILRVAIALELATLDAEQAQRERNLASQSGAV